MRMDFKTAKRLIFGLVLMTVAFSYMEVVFVEQWWKFSEFRFRLSHSLEYHPDDIELDMESSALKVYYDDKLVGLEEYEDNRIIEDDIDNHFTPNVSAFLKEKQPIPKYYHEDDTRGHLTPSNSDNMKDTQNIPKLNMSASKNDVGMAGNSNHSKSRYAPLNLKQTIMNETDFRRKPLMILFSSWIYNTEKTQIHSILRRNWKSWGSIKPAVLTKDHTVRSECRRQGWMVRGLTDVDRACYGPPVLSSMFMDLFKRNDAYFYGYSNADIVYGDGLEQTMKFLFYHYPPWKTKPLLVVGRRYNVNFVKYKNESWRTPTDIKRMAKQGQLVIRSTDYFFTNKHFPWGKAPRVTIGRPFVVRAIIAWALRSGFHVIDATRTIEAVHMTTQDGVYASWHTRGVTCNQRILAALKWSIPTYIGHCECVRLETFHGFNGTIQMRHRPPSKKICSRG